MASKSLLILSLSLTGAWASTGTCLDPSASGDANKENCCSGTGNGQANVGGVLYEYTCNSYANNYGAAALSAPSAYKCAELCTDDSSCHASSWRPTSGGSGGVCWLSSAGFKLTDDKYKSWVILVNTNRAGHVVIPEIEPPAPADCEEQLNQAQDDCNNLIKTHDKDCQGKVKAEIDTCQAAAQQKCDNEKTLLEQSLKAEYEKKLADQNPPPSCSDTMKLDAGLRTPCGNLQSGSIFTVGGIDYRLIRRRPQQHNKGMESNWDKGGTIPSPSHVQTAVASCNSATGNQCDMVWTCNGGKGHSGIHITRSLTNEDFRDLDCCTAVRV